MHGNIHVDAHMAEPRTTRLKKTNISRLKLENFRNYISCTLDCDDRHVVLTGHNGAGKTNVLEAISFLSPGRGLRRASYDAIARQSADGGWNIYCDLEGASGEVGIGTGVMVNATGVENQRRVRIDREPVKSSEELLDHARIVWIIPAMDGLFTGPAAERRRYLDRLVLAVNPGHARAVSSFEKSMRSRNRLLGEHTPDESWLDAIEIQMAEHATAIASARHELVQLLSHLIVENHDPDSAFPHAVINLDGELENLCADMAATDLESVYIDALKTGRRLDQAAGRTLSGPHRSDLKVMHGPKSMAAELCSTGEQKALLVGLTLAHATLTGDLTGRAPILLLDEIAAHLDENRRAALFENLELLGCQAWMTGTDKSLFDALGERAQYFQVEDGKISSLND